MRKFLSRTFSRTPSQPTLQACPFCGSRSVELDSAANAAFCRSCHADGGIKGMANWNRRDPIIAVEALIADLDRNGLPQDAAEAFMSALARIEARRAETPRGAAQSQDGAMTDLFRAAIGALGAAYARQQQNAGTTALPSAEPGNTLVHRRLAAAS